MNFNNAVFEISAGKANQLPQSDLPEIVFSGRSNVGKSSLINKLLSRKSLARVSSTPGKTSTINVYLLKEARLVDLPGYGYAKVSFSEKKRWSELVEGYFNQDRNIGLVIQLIDMRHPPTQNDIHMINFLCDNEIPFIIVLTKSDKLNKSKRAERLNLLKDELIDFEGIKLIPFSSLKGEGLEEIKSVISSVVEDNI